MKVFKSNLSDLIGTLRHDISQKDRQTKGNKGQVEASQKSNASTVHLDSIRHKAMYLNNEIRNWQTYLTTQQVQLLFLDELKNTNNWGSKLDIFLGTEGKADLNQQNPSQDMNKYRDELRLNINNARQKLSKSQVQLQNIFASGLVSEPEIFDPKDTNEINQAFKPLRVETIKNLLR